MSEQDSLDVPSDEEVSCLRRLVTQLRTNLYILEEQAAKFGPLDVPIHVKNGIEETTKLLGQKEEQLRQLFSKGGRLLPKTELKRFWEPFVTEGSKFFITHHAPGKNTPDTRMTVSSLTAQTVFSMYSLLIELFADSCEFSKIRLEMGSVVSQDHNLKQLSASSHPHLIVIDAPGANPLANYLMAQFKGVAPCESTVTRGYIFRVTGNYLDSPFIVSDEALKGRYSAEELRAMQKCGIYDLKPGQPPHRFPRTFKQYDIPSFGDQDCAIVVTGWASLPNENRVRRMVIIAGHSRHSTLFGATFVASSEEWAQRVNALRYFNTETIIGLEPDASGGPVAPSILDGPREIYKQSPIS